ncbi:MAG: DUF4143 domain-containing protein [Proteobacteria bacterium]|nr:DUF4143 domain-containing protein [Pseudomonadota bacterium]
MTKSKFYFFDVGVSNYLQNVHSIEMKSKQFGDAFEQLVFQEIAAYRDYYSKGSIHYWRSDSGHEVDFIIDEEIAVEVKAKSSVNSQDMKGLKALREERLLKKHIIVSLEARPRIDDGILILPWADFVSDLWSGQLAAD